MCLDLPKVKFWNWEVTKFNDIYIASFIRL